MKLKFTKMHGLGNDFVVLDGVSQKLNLSAAQMRFLADRHFGIGCDQILVVEPTQTANVDFRYRIFNADGGEVEQCGNGARCFARFVLENQLTTKKQITVETSSGIIILEAEANNWIKVNMGVPVFTPSAIPLASDELHKKYQLDLPSESVEFGAVSMGNPHAVLLVEDVQAAPVLTLGPTLESHEFFPQRANIGFMQVNNDSHITLRVFERGVGETLACGTGACAAVVIGRHWGKLCDSVTVTLPGGDLNIHWAGEGEPVFLSGPAAVVFQGEIEL